MQQRRPSPRKKPSPPGSWAPKASFKWRRWGGIYTNRGFSVLIRNPGVGLYGVYLGVIHEVVMIIGFGITFAILGILSLLYLTRGNVRGKFG